METDQDVSAAFAAIRDLVAKKCLRPRIDSSYPLEEHKAAYARLASREAKGSILLHP
ncbi:zinc-binding dehydrogenase [Pantoea sp. Tr-811]|uniref:zinc-binding dehydrogenase n=1 Tax=Pantoea sp. Tr-811 TaxID=2608361 RepID=UPI0019650C3E